MRNGFTAERAWKLLREWTASPSLVKHSLATFVQAMAARTRAYGILGALRLGLSDVTDVELVELYAIAASLHNFDFDIRQASGARRAEPSQEVRLLRARSSRPLSSYSTEKASMICRQETNDAERVI